MKRDNIISEVEEKDLEQLKSILKNVFNNKISYEKMQDLYKISKENKDIYVLGYYINDNLVGTVTLNILTLPSGKEATVWDLAIKEKYRRLGIATKLMNKAEEIAKQENTKKYGYSAVFTEEVHMNYIEN